MRIPEAKAVHATLKKRIKSIYHPFFFLAERLLWPGFEFENVLDVIDAF